MEEMSRSIITENESTTTSTGEPFMSNVAAVLREEIKRVARKEVKAQTASTAQAVAKYRSEIAKLKRQLREQRQKDCVLGEAGT